MDKEHGWKAYGEMAWTGEIVSCPEEAARESRKIVALAKRHGLRTDSSLLHFGCGAGFHDWTFKRHFRVTGLDISPAMLETARRLNPEVSYFEGDMRHRRLPGVFDAVVAADSIAYMSGADDLRRCLANAAAHLESGGLLVFMTLTAENFRENNFVYHGSRNGTTVTIFENDCRTAPEANRYEATLFYHVRRPAGCETHIEKHVLGLFPFKTWETLLGEAGFAFRRYRGRGFYDRWITGRGIYETDFFVCRLARKVETVPGRLETAAARR